jgi:integrase
VNKELQRVTREAIKTLDGKDIILEFPAGRKKGKSILVLKLPKTESSIRKVYLPESVARMLVEYKQEQDELKDFYDQEYTDYNLVLCSGSGSPLSQNQILKKFKKLIRDNNLPPVVFHSLRHSSVTYKLKLSGGDIKSVQGDSGHAQVDMVTDVYSHIIDEDRRKNTELFEEAFYKKKNLNPDMNGQSNGGNSQEAPAHIVTVPETIDPVVLQKALLDPEMAALIKALAAGMEKAR